MRVAIYARVSTEDKGQDPENQLGELRTWCANAGHTIAHEYIDRESGRKGVHMRRQFAALFEDAHRRKFDCVLFWALDRFSREVVQPGKRGLHSGVNEGSAKLDDDGNLVVVSVAEPVEGHGFD
jgi:DNA invertase Pin-like site-specific DNA recombinase